METAFHSTEEAFSPLSLLGGPLVTLCAAPVWRLQPWGPFTWGGAGVVALFGIFLSGATCVGSAVRATWLRRTLALLMTVSLADFLLLDMVRGSGGSASRCGSILVARPLAIPRLRLRKRDARGTRARGSTFSIPSECKKFVYGRIAIVEFRTFRSCRIFSTNENVDVQN